MRDKLRGRTGFRIADTNWRADDRSQPPKRALAAVLPVAVLALLPVAGCGGDEGTSADASESNQQISFQLDFTPNGAHAPFLVAQERGYFAEEGLEVEFIAGKGSQYSVDAVAAGRVTLAKAAVPNVIIGIAKGQDVVSVASLVGKGVFGFFVPEEAPVQEIADLAGHSILSAAGTPQAALLPSILGINGVDIADVDVANISASALLNTYAGGEGEALVTDIPFGTPVVQPKRPSRTFPWADHGLPVPGYSIIASRETLDQDPDLIERFLRAAYRGQADALEEPEAAVDALVNQFPTVDPEVALEQLEVIGEYRCPSDFRGKPFGFHSQVDWDVGVEEMSKAVDLTGPQDAADYYTNEFFTGKGSVAQDQC